MKNGEKEIKVVMRFKVWKWNSDHFHYKESTDCNICTLKLICQPHSSSLPHVQHQLLVRDELPQEIPLFLILDKALIYNVQKWKQYFNFRMQHTPQIKLLIWRTWRRSRRTLRTVCFSFCHFLRVVYSVSSITFTWLTANIKEINSISTSIFCTFVNNPRRIFRNRQEQENCDGNGTA